MIRDFTQIMAELGPGPLPLNTRDENVQVLNLHETVPFNRAYANNSTSLRALTAQNRAVVLANDGQQPPPAAMKALYARDALFNPTMVQGWRGGPAPKLPARPTNPWGELIEPNPFVTGDKAGQNSLIKFFPELAKVYEALAKDPWGYMAEQNAEEAKRAALAKIQFGEAEFESNPYRDTSVPQGLEAQARFHLKHPELVEIYKIEASYVSLGWEANSPNRYSVNQLVVSLKEDPIIADGIRIDETVALLAVELDQRLLASEIIAAERALEAAERAAAALRK